MKKLIIAIILSVFTAGVTLSLQAADQPAAPAQGGTKPARERGMPFNGKLAALDKQAKTIKVGERTFEITSQTRIVKDGKPATLDDVTVGEMVGGAYRKVEGKLEVTMLRLGTKAPGKAKPKEDAQ